MPVTNPIRLLHAALWNILQNQADFVAAVPAGNRIKYTGTARAPEKDTLSSADYPQVRIVARGVRPHLHQTSSGSSLTILWAIEISSGDQRSRTLFDVEWSIYRAMVDWETHVTAVIWNGIELVKSCRLVAVKTDLGDPQVDRGNRGWSAVWAGETELWITTGDL